MKDADLIQKLIAQNEAYQESLNKGHRWRLPRKIPTVLALLAGNLLMLGSTPFRALALQPDNPPPTPGITVERERKITPDPNSDDYWDTVRVVYEHALEPYDLTLPPDLNRDMAKAILFALENGAAKNLDRQDFFHCHLLMSRADAEKYEPSNYRGKLSEYFDSSISEYAGIVCHTQEYTNNGLDPQKRNVLIFRGGEPYIPLAPSGKGLVVPDINQLTGQDYRGSIQLTFDPHEEGEIVLDEARRLNAIVELPHVYTLNTTPRTMEVDLPVKK